MDTVSAESGPRLAVQHLVFTLPCQYWALVFHNRWLLAEMSRIAADVILEICHQADVEPGIFTVSTHGGVTSSGIRISIYRQLPVV